MKQKEKVLGIVRCYSAILILIMDLLAAFLPYSLEVFWGIAMVGLCGYAVSMILRFKEAKSWESVPALILAAAAFVLTLVFLCGGSLSLYYPIEIVNLLLAACFCLTELIKIGKDKTKWKTGKKTVLAVMAVLICVIGALSAVSHIGYGRSLFSSVVENFLKASNSGAFDSAEAADAYMEERAAVNDDEYVLPGRNYESSVHIENISSHQVIYYDGSGSTDGNVMYIHGGAYVNETSAYHIAFCDRLAKKINYTVVAPIYPLAPNHTYEETYELVEEIYAQLLADGKPIIIMGDSAGGGFSAAFCEYLNEKGIRQPDKAVLLSPWVDVSMSGGTYDDYYDPMLGAPGLRRMGERWCGDLDIQDYRISPLFGNVDNFPKTLLLVGTREIFNPDVRAFNDKLAAAGIDTTLIVGKGMNHVFPVYPTLEGRIALNTIAEFVID